MPVRPSESVLTQAPRLAPSAAAVGFVCLVGGAATVAVPFLGCLGVPLLFAGGALMLIDDFRAGQGPAGVPRGAARPALGLVGGILLFGLCAEVGRETSMALLEGSRGAADAGALLRVWPASLYVLGVGLIIISQRLRARPSTRTMLLFASAPWATAGLCFLVSKAWPLTD